MQEAIPNGYILTNKVVHSRLLPSAASHAFTYPTVAFLVSLNALESSRLDLARGWLFSYGGIWGRLTGIRPSAYLHDYNFTLAGQESPLKLNKISAQDGVRWHHGAEVKNAPTITQKLRDVLRRYGHDPAELFDAWMLTMPSYFGFEGINPLTVYYCYRKDDRSLWIVVLEVHNTFGERHVYVLRAGKESEETDIPPGFTHSWIIPRQFHVSPFNDRSGYYRCSVVEPWRHPDPQIAQDGAELPSDTNRRLPTVQIHLYTSQPSRLKITALLRPTSALPLTSRALLSTLLAFPLTLFLSFPRIAYEAYRLHYNKHLDVYGRPEPRAVDESVEQAFTSEKIHDTRNPVQERGGSGHTLGRGGGVGWQPEGILECYSRRIVEECLKHQAHAQCLHISLISTNPSLNEKHFLPVDAKTDEKSSDYLTITYRTSRFFLVLLSAPSPQHALLLARVEGLCTVSDESFFIRVFSGPQSGPRTRLTGMLCGLAQNLRRIPIPFSLLSPSFPFTSNPLHPLDLSYNCSSSPPTSSPLRPLCNIIIILTSILLIRLEETIFYIFHARFVPGDETWLAWTRASDEWLKNGKEQLNEEQRRSSALRDYEKVGSLLRY